MSNRSRTCKILCQLCRCNVWKVHICLHLSFWPKLVSMPPTQSIFKPICAHICASCRTIAIAILLGTSMKGKTLLWCAYFHLQWDHFQLAIWNGDHGWLKCAQCCKVLRIFLVVNLFGTDGSLGQRLWVWTESIHKLWNTQVNHEECQQQWVHADDQVWFHDH